MRSEGKKGIAGTEVIAEIDDVGVVAGYDAVYHGFFGFVCADFVDHFLSEYSCSSADEATNYARHENMHSLAFSSSCTPACDVSYLITKTLSKPNQSSTWQILEQ